LDKLLNENDIALVGLQPQLVRTRLARSCSGGPERVYVDYVQNLYSILAQLRAKHPRVEIESCSGGGAGLISAFCVYADQVWPSDNTDAFDRLLIQDGFAYAYAPGVMMA
jgi:alpha-galactosidase